VHKLAPNEKCPECLDVFCCSEQGCEGAENKGASIVECIQTVPGIAGENAAASGCQKCKGEDLSYPYFRKFSFHLCKPRKYDLMKCHFIKLRLDIAQDQHVMDISLQNRKIFCVRNFNLHHYHMVPEKNNVSFQKYTEIAFFSP
jgi:hypothetical protein